jgi:putative ABC transport system ATP-binding protein
MLRLAHISKTFHLGTQVAAHVLEDVTLDVLDGESVVILGANGSGKSTLLRIVAGELSPDGGRITVDGRDVTDMPPYKRSAYLSFVRQGRDENLASHLTVRETLALVVTKHSVWFRPLLTSDVRDRVARVLEGPAERLQKRLDDRVRTLSGGEHQLLTIVVAAESIVRGRHLSRVLLLDEPVAHLDPGAAHEVMDLTVDLIRKHCLTAIIVTHDLELTRKYGERVIVLKDHRAFSVGEMPNDPLKIADLS